MPRKAVKKHMYQVSKEIRASLPFVFSWCTDYREDDTKITGSKNRRKILHRSKQYVIYLTTFKGRRHPWKAVSIVTLTPPSAWHLDFFGDHEDCRGEYRLRRVKPGLTRLSMVFNEVYKITKAPTKAEDAESTSQLWDKYIERLEADYRRSA
ncbi:MAG: hypothetical protein ABSF82_09140 [Candidatus Bathyarchaeia archaeon]